MAQDWTPGPWKVGEDGDVWGCDGTDCVSITPDTLRGDANARLIAEAPAMVAILQAVVGADAARLPVQAHIAAEARSVLERLA